MDVNDLYNQIHRRLHENADHQHAEADKRFHKYKGYRTFGIKAPELTKVLRSFRKEIAQLTCEEVFDLAERLYKDEIEETILAGNVVLYTRTDCVSSNTLSFLDRMLEHFRSWSTIDDFCINILQPLLFDHPKETLKYLRRWNTSENMWKRRASVVAFVRTAGESGRFTDEALTLCSNLVNDEEDLVQKGVGWCLKDVMRGDKKKVVEYVKELRRTGVPSTITLYAIRDLKGRERESVLRVKKQKDTNGTQKH